MELGPQCARNVRMTSLTISDEEDDHDNDDFFDVQVSTFKL
jgi:hypothetical protein